MTRKDLNEDGWVSMLKRAYHFEIDWKSPKIPQEFVNDFNLSLDIDHEFSKKFSLGGDLEKVETRLSRLFSAVKN
jgi:hypothetical protein